MRRSFCGDAAIQLETPGDVTTDSVRRAQLVAEQLWTSRPAAVIDIVPVYGRVTVYFDPTQRDAATRWLDDAINALRRSPTTDMHEPACTEVPVCYGEAFSPDIEAIAARIGRTRQEIIDLHTAGRYVVGAIGFLPGFSYLLGLNSALHTPRLATPRPRVPAGAVGIGGAQTGIYPCNTPGGWNIIGRTPLAMFDARRSPPALLRCGDPVTFRPISSREFARWK